MRNIFNIAFAVLLCASAMVEARINLFDPWFPGQDSTVGTPGEYQPLVLFMTGEYFSEVPVQLSYHAGPRVEVGGRWGLRSVKNIIGISDLMLGLKYAFLEKGKNAPGVIGEAAVSLPTGDAAKEIGTGAVAFLFHWALEQKIENVTGYFGLGIRLNSENAQKIQEGNIFSYHIGASYPYSPRLRLHGEIKGFNHGTAKIGGISAENAFQELYLAPGANCKLNGTMLVSSSLLIGLTPASHDLGLLISTNF